MDLEKWKSQVRKGMLEYGLLHLVKTKGSLYGLEMIETLAQDGLEITEGTLYPLLNRLTKERILKPKWEMQNISGHPRKYYQLSAQGEKLLQMMDSEWKKISESIKDLKGENHDKGNQYKT